MLPEDRAASGGGEAMGRVALVHHSVSVGTGDWGEVTIDAHTVSQPEIIDVGSS